jgi:hypothetical protein
MYGIRQDVEDVWNYASLVKVCSRQLVQFFRTKHALVGEWLKDRGIKKDEGYKLRRWRTRNNKSYHGFCQTIFCEAEERLTRPRIDV